MNAAESAPLIARAASGETAAVDELLARHLSGLRAFIRLRIGPVLRGRESESDLVQSVCREVLQDLSSYEHRSEALFKSWLYTAALRKIADRGRYWARDRRDARREVAAPDDLGAVYRDALTPSRSCMAREELAAIESAFDELPDRYREVITLSRVCGLATPELAERLGVTEHYARTLLSRALARLSRLMREG